MTSDQLDVAVIGGGILGLATAYRLLERCPTLRLAVLEAEPELASHQSGHNSGVLHAGLYYRPSSLKARLCREGKDALETFADQHGIPYEHCGKLVVALSAAELQRLEALKERAVASGVPGLQVVGSERIRELEPMAAGLQALWSPTTGIIDFRRVALAFADEVRTRGARIHTSRRVVGVRSHGRDLVLTTTQGDLVTRDLIACAGLQSDRVAAMTSDRGTEQIVPFRGDYYTLSKDARSLVRGLIYPVADPRLPFLGVHFTKRIDGEVWAGPNAVLALARHGYHRRDVSLRDLTDTISKPGFLRMARRFWRTGLVEQWRDISKRAFAAELRRYVPAIRDDQLTFGPSGVRAQAVDRDGSLVDDFRLGGGRHIMHVRNAPSPAATASLAIGRELAEAAIERFELTQHPPH